MDSVCNVVDCLFHFCLRCVLLPRITEIGVRLVELLYANKNCIVIGNTL